MFICPHNEMARDELRELLLELSVVSLRLARQLTRAPKMPRTTQRHPYTRCPFYRERRRTYEAI